jgi:hypothetical protein
MKKSNISQDDAENIMIALDQVSQTIDVMNSVVTRLKHRMSHSLGRQPQTAQKDSITPEKTATNSNAVAMLKNRSIH